MNYCKNPAVPNYAKVSNVHITDPFFAPFIQKIRSITTPDIFAKFMADGAIENYRRVARGEKGNHAGPPWYHGLICEVIRGVSDILAVHYDKSIDERLDSIIDAMADAQAADPEGWINPYTTLICPEKRWGLNGGNVRWQHETYNAGCLVEAGVHHYRATGKTKLLVVAVKMANYLADRIGIPPKWNVVCEHALPEMALVSMERLFDEEPELAEKVGAKRGEYLRLADFFINNKGNHTNRHQFPPFLQEYAQDHRPAKEQREAVGHAVRATLFYTGMSDVALANGDEELKEAAVAIWHDIVETKLHINGSVGAFSDDERFGQQYDLPNDAYLETCAGVGLAFFGASVFKLTGDGAVWETVENTLTNLMPAAVSEDGVHYTYVNPLESKGDIERWSWHECPCCPPMLLKLVGIMPSYIFAEEGDNLWLNLYIDSKVSFGDVSMTLSNKKLTVNTKAAKTLRIRIPSWAYDFALKIDGKILDYTADKNYAVVCVAAGLTDIEIEYKEKITKYVAHPWVNTQAGLIAVDAGRVAVKRGPVLYCCEKEVEKLGDLDPLFTDTAPVFRDDGIIEMTAEDGTVYELIEYRKWNNHGALPMRVWLRQEGVTEDRVNLGGWEGKLYREFAVY